MNRIRPALILTVAALLTGASSPCWADDDSTASEETPPPRPVFAAIDFDAIPIGALPPMPAADDAPKGATAEASAPGIAVEKMNLPTPKPRKGKRPSPHTMNANAMPQGLHAKVSKTELVELRLDHAEAGNLYVSNPEETEFAGDSIGRIPCRQAGASTPVRWETATVAGDDAASIEFKDLWFDSQTCTVHPGSTTRVAFKAVAWDGEKPWLYAIRDDRSITFLMPRSYDVSGEASVGVPVTVSGGFARVTLPLGRWGSSSFVAHLGAATLDAPVPAAPATSPTRVRLPQGFRVSVRRPPAPDVNIEVAVEVVQTMSEKSPTLLVRRVPVEGHTESQLEPR